MRDWVTGTEVRPGTKYLSLEEGVLTTVCLGRPEVGGRTHAGHDCERRPAHRRHGDQRETRTRRPRVGPGGCPPSPARETCPEPRGGRPSSAAVDTPLSRSRRALSPALPALLPSEGGRRGVWTHLLDEERLAGGQGQPVDDAEQVPTRVVDDVVLRVRGVEGPGQVPTPTVRAVGVDDSVTGRPIAQTGTAVVSVARVSVVGTPPRPPPGRGRWSPGVSSLPLFLACVGSSPRCTPRVRRP